MLPDMCLAMQRSHHDIRAGEKRKVERDTLPNPHVCGGQQVWERVVSAASSSRSVPITYCSDTWHPDIRSRETGVIP